MLKTKKISEKNREQRRVIANAAISVIHQAGLEGTRLRDVARVANVTTGAVTHYFDSKDAVLVAALEEVVQNTLDRIDQGMAQNQPGDVDAFVARMSAYIPVDEEGRREWRVWLSFWGRAIADPVLRKMHQDYYRAFTDKLTISLLTLRPSPPARGVAQATSAQEMAMARECADAVIAAIDGIGTRATLDPDLWDAERQRQTLAALLSPLLQRFASAGETVSLPSKG